MGNDGDSVLTECWFDDDDFIANRQLFYAAFATRGTDCAAFEPRCSWRRAGREPTPPAFTKAYRFDFDFAFFAAGFAFAASFFFVFGAAATFFTGVFFFAEAFTSPWFTASIGCPLSGSMTNAP